MNNEEKVVSNYKETLEKKLNGLSDSKVIY
jgi:hypothetical protein